MFQIQKPVGSMNSRERAENERRTFVRMMMQGDCFDHRDRQTPEPEQVSSNLRVVSSKRLLFGF